MTENIQNIKEGWVEVELGILLQLSKEKYKPDEEKALFYVGLEHIEKNTGNLTDNVGIELIKTVKNSFSSNQILYGKLRPYLNKVHLSNKNGVCSTDILVFNVPNVLVSLYILHYMLSRKFVNDMSNNTNGVNLPRVSTKYINSYSIPLAPLPIQRAIVSKIETLFSDLDNGIASLKKAQEQLKIYRQAVLKKAFEGELTKEWRDNYVQTHGRASQLPTAEELLIQIKQERQNHYENQIEDWKKAVETFHETSKNGKEGKKPKALKELPPLTEAELNYLHILPKNWDWVKAGDIMKLVTNGTTPKGNKVSILENDVPFLKIHNLSLRGEFLLDYKLHYISKEVSEIDLNRSRIFPNDVLINTVGPPLGKSAIVNSKYSEYNTNQNVTIYRTFEKYSPKFLNFFLISPTTVKWIKDIATATSGQSYMNLGHCRNIPIPLCSLPEQHQIVQEIETRLSVCDKVEQTITDSLKKSEALRQSILKKAFEGKLLSAKEIEACKQESDYEPASVLLEKIKAEKLAKEQAAKKSKPKKKSKK